MSFDPLQAVHLPAAVDTEMTQLVQAVRVPYAALAGQSETLVHPLAVSIYCIHSECNVPVVSLLIDDATVFGNMAYDLL